MTWCIVEKTRNVMNLVDGDKSAIRIATFGGSWAKGKTATVVVDGAATLACTNLFSNIGSGANDRKCAIARDGTAWYVIAAEC
jgi:hypothetical protein